MFGKGILLLDTLIFSFFYSQVSLSDAKLLDSTSPVIDDQYDGCRKEALEKFIPDLFKEERDKNEKLQKIWTTWKDWRTSINCTSQVPGGTEYHTSALFIYQNVDEGFLKDLNNAVETMMVNVTTYEKDFHFKALHFLLVDSMMLLKPKCRKVYAILEDGEKVPKINSKVRFASFTEVDSDLWSVDLDGITILKIKTCFYVNLEDQLCLRNLGKILLSPVEVFTVERIDKKAAADGEEYTEVVLNHSDLQSNHNCVMFSRSAADISTHLFLPLLVALPLYYMCL